MKRKTVNIELVELDGTCSVSNREFRASKLHVPRVGDCLWDPEDKPLEDGLAPSYRVESVMWSVDLDWIYIKAEREK